MKKTLLLLISVSFLLTACYSSLFYENSSVLGDGNIIHKNVAVSEFSSITISGAFETEIFVGKPGDEVEIIADANLMDFISVRVSSNQLRVSHTSNTSLRPSQRIRINIPATQLTDLGVSGANRVAVHDIDTADFSLRSSGSTRIMLSGQATKLSIRTSGSSRIGADDLKAEHVEIRTSGSTRATLNAAKSLEARTSGSSRIEYKGNPSEVHVNTSGSSRVRRIE